MPGYTSLGLDEPYELAPAKWDSIEFTHEWSDEFDAHATSGSVFVRGPSRFTGSVSLRIRRLPAGAVLQVRMSEYADDTLMDDHPIHEIHGSDGDTFGTVPLTHRLGAGRGMRVRLLNQATVPVTITSAVLTVLAWKES